MDLSDVLQIGSAAANISGNYMNNLEAEHRQHMAQDWQTNERINQNMWNLGLWNLNNEYNSPLAQKDRLKEAGINPALMEGTGQSVEASTAQGASNGSVPNNYVPTTYGQGINQALGNLLQMEDLKSKRITNQTLGEYNRSMIDKMRAETQQAVESGNLSHLQGVQIETLLPGMLRKTNAEADVIELQYDEILAKIENIEADTNLKNEQALTEDDRRTNLSANTRLATSQAVRQELNNFFQQSFGVDPTTGPISMLIQGLLSGDKRAKKTMDQLFETLRGYAQGFLGQNPFFGNSDPLDEDFWSLHPNRNNDTYTPPSERRRLRRIAAAKDKGSVRGSNPRDHDR